MLLLAACGGGGGGSGPDGSVTNSGSGSGDGSWLTFSPSPVRLTTYVNESIGFSVQAKATKAFQENARVLVLDTTGTITPVVSYRSLDPYTYEVFLTTMPMQPGTHNTTLEVRVCQDDPRVCAQPFPGSPWHLPLTVEVKDAVAGAARIATTTDFRASITEDETAATSAWFFKIALQTSADAPHLLYTRVTDSNHVFVSSAKTGLLSANETKIIGLNTWHPLNPGTYETTIQVELCRNEQNPCTDPFPGSPLRFPVKFDVTPSGNSADRLIVSPSSADVEAFTDELKPLQIGLMGRPGLTGRLYASVTDPAGYFTDEFVDGIVEDGLRSLTTKTSLNLQALGPGSYDTVLRVEVCRYAVAYGAPCDAPQPGSPWMIPVHVTVKARPPG
jgi:hypothetical protein